MSLRLALDTLLPAQFTSLDQNTNPNFKPSTPPYLPLPANRKRVVITSPSSCQLIGSLHGLILDMVNRGHRVSAFAPKLTSKDLRVLSHIGAEGYSLPPESQIFDRYKRFRELTDLFRDIDPHVVLVQSARNGALSVAAAKRAQVPYVVTVVPSFGPSFMEGAPRSAWAERQAMKNVYRTIFSWSDAVVFHSSHDKKYARQYRLISESKPQMTVGGWGEDLTRHFKKPLPGLDRGALFLMATPLDYSYGIAEYCEAAKQMRLKARKAKFFLASIPGETRTPFPVSELKRYREYVQYIGPVDDAAAIIARCHVFVSPSYGDGVPRSLFQALALGRPIIASDTRSCRDFVLHGVNGYRVPVKDAVVLAKAMTHTLQRPDLISRMAEESRKQAQRFYDINSVNALVLNALGL